MPPAPSSRPVFSTDRRRLCPKCGWPEAECKCSARFDQALPERLVATLRIEKGGRGGKTVTVIDSLPRNAEFLTRLLSELKRACGSGGAQREAALELQGDQRERARALLAARGFVVKG